MRRLFYLVVALTIFGSAQAQQAGPSYVELILDASGSMWNTLDDGRYRIIAAKDVLTQFVSGLPEGDLNVGLRIYGSQMGALEAGACDDTALFVPLEGVDKAALTRSVQEADAVGATPIVHSLLAAAEDFPADAGRRLIVLVTDGEESCGGDLQSVAEDLGARGVEVDIRIIGFDLTPEAAASFEGVGTFENAEDAGSLAQALEAATQDVVGEAPAAVDVCNAEATLTLPGGVEASYPFRIPFEGPEGYISVHPVGGDDYSALTSAYTGWGNPAELTAPGEAGDYELRYTASAGRCVVVAEALTVLPIQVSLEPPAKVEAGFGFGVPFEGPEGYLTVNAPGDAPNHNNNVGYAYTGWDNPAQFNAPSQSGVYELRYYDANGTLLTSAPLEVTSSQASLSGPESAEAGFDIAVPFDGPEGYITVNLPDDPENHNQHLAYAYTDWGNPATLTAPSEAAAYELRYYDTNGGVIVRAPLAVTASTATLDAPATAEAGYTFEVSFRGPEGYLTVNVPGDPETRNANLGYAYSGWGNPAVLGAPVTAGDYEVRYYDTNGSVVSSAPLTVTESRASAAPVAVDAGSTFSLPFEGPEGYLTVNLPTDEVDRNSNLGYAYTGWGNPAELTAPGTPGDYELRYYANPENGHGGLLLRLPLKVR